MGRRDRLERQERGYTDIPNGKHDNKNKGKDLIVNENLKEEKQSEMGEKNN
jgi:hypothetical protein